MGAASLSLGISLLSQFSAHVSGKSQRGREKIKVLTFHHAMLGLSLATKSLPVQ